MFRKFIQRIGLKTYGDALCSPRTSQWIFFTTIGVLLMSTLEGTGWAYVGYFLGSDQNRYLVAVATGLVAMLAIWIVDATFLTLDFRHNRYRDILEDPGQPEKTGKKKLLGALNSPWAGVGLRLVLVAGSLTIVAPYISQLVLARDVVGNLAQERAAEVQEGRNQVAARHDRAIAQLSAEADSLQTQLVNETAGKGPSRLLGYGPTAKTIAKRLQDAETRIEQARSAKEAELRAYDSMDAQERTKKYGVVTTADGIQARNKAMEAIKSQPGYRRTEWTIRAFLLGLFLILLVLKIYQPEDAKIYYSSVCQDIYKGFLAGKFDSLLIHEKDHREWMTPVAFETWVRTGYRDHIRCSRNAAILASIRTNQNLQETNLQDIEKVAMTDLAPLSVDLDQEQAEVEKANNEISELESDLKEIEAGIQDQSEAIAQMDSRMNSTHSATTFTLYAEKRESWSEELSNLEKRQRSVRLSLDKSRSSLKAHQDQVTRIQAAMESRATVLAHARESIDKTRNRALDEIEKRTGI